MFPCHDLSPLSTPVLLLIDNPPFWKSVPAGCADMGSGCRRLGERARLQALIWMDAVLPDEPMVG